MKIVSEIKGKVAWLSLDNEKAMNALSKSMLTDIEAALRKYEKDSAVRVIVIRGAGDRAFAAGADITELKQLNPSQAQMQSNYVHGILDYVSTYPKPVIAMIQGVALGGGFELSLACHLRISTPEALLGFPEIKLGLVPGYGGNQRFKTLVGREKALRYILTGDYFTATKAYSMGAVSIIHEQSDILAKTQQLADKLSFYSSEAMGAALEILHESSTKEAHEKEQALFGQLFGTKNASEGISAFLEKRKANFQ